MLDPESSPEERRNLPRGHHCYCPLSNVIGQRFVEGGMADNNEVDENLHRGCLRKQNQPAPNHSLILTPLDRCTTRVCIHLSVLGTEPTWVSRLGRHFAARGRARGNGG